MGTVTRISNVPSEWPSHDGGPPMRHIEFGERACPRCDCPLQRISDPGWLDCPCTCHESAHALLAPPWRRP